MRAAPDALPHRNSARLSRARLQALPRLSPRTGKKVEAVCRGVGAETVCTPGGTNRRGRGCSLGRRRSRYRPTARTHNVPTCGNRSMCFLLICT